jgi:hypothetical protein
MRLEIAVDEANADPQFAGEAPPPQHPVEQQRSCETTAGNRKVIGRGVDQSGKRRRFRIGSTRLCRLAREPAQHAHEPGHANGCGKNRQQKRGGQQQPTLGARKSQELGETRQPSYR